MTASPPEAYTTAQSAVLEAYDIGFCSDLSTQVSGTPGVGIVDFTSNALYQPGPNVKTRTR